MKSQNTELSHCFPGQGAYFLFYKQVIGYKWLQNFLFHLEYKIFKKLKYSIISHSPCYLSYHLPIIIQSIIISPATTAILIFSGVEDNSSWPNLQSEILSTSRDYAWSLQYAKPAPAHFVPHNRVPKMPSFVQFPPRNQHIVQH